MWITMGVSHSICISHIAFIILSPSRIVAIYCMIMFASIISLFCIDPVILCLHGVILVLSGSMRSPSSWFCFYLQNRWLWNDTILNKLKAEEWLSLAHGILNHILLNEMDSMVATHFLHDLASKPIYFIQWLHNFLADIHHEALKCQLILSRKTNKFQIHDRLIKFIYLKTIIWFICKICKYILSSIWWISCLYTADVFHGHHHIVVMPSTISSGHRQFYASENC